MKKWMDRVWVVAIVIVAALLMGASAYAQESAYASGTTSAALTFGPGPARTVVDSVYATTDKENGAVAIYARGSFGKAAPTSSPTNGADVVSVANANFAVAAGLTTNDSVVYVHANGTCAYRTISAATASTVTLSSALTTAGASGDYLYEVTQQGSIVVGFDGADAGTNDTLVTSGKVFVTPADSPLYMVLDGTAACKLMATVSK
jgi:hypothetical protein